MCPPVLAPVENASDWQRPCLTGMPCRARQIPRFGRSGISPLGVARLGFPRSESGRAQSSPHCLQFVRSARMFGHHGSALSARVTGTRPARRARPQASRQAGSIPLRRQAQFALQSGPTPRGLLIVNQAGNSRRGHPLLGFRGVLSRADVRGPQVSRNCPAVLAGRL